MESDHIYQVTKEQIEYLVISAEDAYWDAKNFRDGYPEYSQEEYDIELAQIKKVLNRQVPQSPVYDVEKDVYVCPVCGAFVSHEIYSDMDTYVMYYTDNCCPRYRQILRD